MLTIGGSTCIDVPEDLHGISADLILESANEDLGIIMDDTNLKNVNVKKLGI